MTAAAGFLREVLTVWRRDNQAASHAAALAYYTLFSLTPLLSLVVIVAGLVLGRAAAEGEVVTLLARFVGDATAHTIDDLVRHASLPEAGIVPTVLSFAALAYGASAVFGQLRASFDHVFHVQPPARNAVYALLRHHVVGLGMILATGGLLLASVALSAGAGLVQGRLERFIPPMPAALAWGNAALAFVMATTLCALLFRYVPDVGLHWRDVWLGALVTTVLFAAGKSALGWYLGRSGVTSIYGAAGSLVLLLLWIFYSAQILLLGATFTEVYSRRYGSRRPL